MPLMTGAEAWTHDGGPVGVLVIHGFTGSPISMRPWAEHLAAEGFTEVETAALQVSGGIPSDTSIPIRSLDADTVLAHERAAREAPPTAA